MPDRSSAIAIGTAPRADVRKLLGAPVVASTRWGFDIFRTSTTQSEVAIAVTPWPVPFARFEDEIHRYTLVTYGADGVVAAVASGLFRRPAAWRRTSPIETDLRALHVRAAELLLFLDPEGEREVNLLAAPPLRDLYLTRARQSAGCTAVVGCVGHGCPDRVAVDGATPGALPLRNAHVYWTDPAGRAAWLAGIEPHGRDPAKPWLETLVALTVSPGEHTIVWSARFLAGSASTVFACGPGDVIYVAIDVASEQTFWRTSLRDWRITQSSAMPEPFSRRALVLMHDGHWHVDAEPAP